MLAAFPDPPRRTDRNTCPACEASAAGCRSIAWLGGRNCCDACPGDHDRRPADHRPTEEPRK